MSDPASRPPAGGDDDDDDRTLTDRQGHPVADDRDQRTVGERGPATLGESQFLEVTSRFDRERIPGRVVHARGTAVLGPFEAYGVHERVAAADDLAEV